LRRWIESEHCSLEVPSTALLQGVVKQHPSPQMTCFAMLDSEEP